MAGKNTIEAKLRIAADFADAVRDLQALKREIKGTGDAAREAGSDASGAKATTAAQKESAAAARDAATERTRAAKQAGDAEKQSARESAAAEREAKRQSADEARKLEKARKDAAKAAAAAEKDSAKAASAERRKAAQLAPQVTDILTGLAGGQNPLLVAIQQGGQLRDVMGGTGNAVKALMGLFTPMRVGILGVVAGAALVAKAFFEAKDESDLLNRSIASTGNIAATSVGQVNQQARQVADEQKVSVGSVRETLNALLTTGQFTSTTLASATKAVTVFSRATGASSADAIKQFGDMGNGVAAWAIKTNQQYNFVTAAQVNRIRQLESEGKAQEAMRVALDAFAETMQARVVPSTNSLDRAWQGFGRTLSSVWDSWKKFFQDETVDDRMTKMRSRIEELQRIIASSGNLGSVKARARAELESLREQENELNRLAIADQNRRDAGAQAAQQEQDKIARSSKSFQDTLASVDAAGAQKRLAAQLAALDQQRAEVELQHQRGLLSEQDFNLKLNAIEQQRLEAQAANIKRQIEIERGRVDEKLGDKEAKDARVTALETQLLEVQAKIRQTVTAARGVIDSDALTKARADAIAWAGVWQQAFNAVRQLSQRNAIDRAATSDSTDPAARAEAAAAAAQEALKEQVKQAQESLKIQLSLDIPENMKDSLRQQAQELADNLDEALSNIGRKVRFDSLRDQFAQLQADLAQRVGEIDQALAAGTITSTEAERQAFAERAKTIPQLERILALQQQLAATPNEKKSVSQSTAELDLLKAKALEVETVMRTSVRDSFASAFTDFVTGAKSAGEAMRDFVKGVAQAMLQLIARKLGEQLVQSLFGASGSSGGNGSNAGWAAFLASFFHGGGVVGGMSSMTRAVSPMLFATAARYHSGGIGGLAPDEVPAVLRKGEEVLTADDPRHRANGGRMASIDNLQVNVSVSTGSSAGGNEAALGQRMANAMRQTAVDVMTEEMRPGGLLARNR